LFFILVFFYSNQLIFNSDSDDEDYPRQPVPDWAQREALMKALQMQLQSPRTVFGEIPPYNKKGSFFFFLKCF